MIITQYPKYINPFFKFVPADRDRQLFCPYSSGFAGASAYILPEIETASEAVQGVMTIH